ncbi:MAG: phosphoglucosamine mutase [Candidatus Hydrogenedentes bacterium]|nr:phosphoglucosamine mutase [Candidatus Hydrogenedentota bacterium]
MPDRLFGTDGIRGKANIHPMTAEMALKVGRAAGHLFQNGSGRHTILIGKDTRRSCYMLENALTAGLCSVGINVLLTGPLPTPGVSYIMRSLRCDGAIMISASHNHYADNGIKLFGRDGYKIPDEAEDEIERLIVTGEVDKLRPTGNDIGVARRIDDAVGRYIEFVKASFPKGMRLDGLRIVVDCSNGATYKAGPNTLRELGAEVIAIGDRPDGSNINEDVGSVHPEEMRATVIRERADLGIAFDGDGDRLVMADGNGRLLDGNALLAILGIDRLERDELPEKTIATTIMANGGLARALAPLGGRVVHTQVGDRYVVEAMREQGLAIGGESSGHMIILDHNTTGDAIIAALQVLAIIVRKEQPLTDLAHAYQEMPESHQKIPLNGRPKPSQESLDALVEEIRDELEGKGRVVIRPSGTEPIVRIMVQHQDARAAQTLTKQLADRVAAM